MTRDEITEMAREAGLPLAWISEEGILRWSELERFAALVAAAEREAMKLDGWRQCAKGQRTTQYCGQLEAAVSAEREACATKCESHYDTAQAARAIRARGEA
jgi:hypothetical protein